MGIFVRVLLPSHGHEAEVFIFLQQISGRLIPCESYSSIVMIIFLSPIVVASKAYQRDRT